MTDILSHYKSRLDRVKGQKELEEKNLKNFQQKLTDLTARRVFIEEAQVLIQQTAKETQEQLIYHVEDLVQSAVDTCFPGEYDFRMEFEIKRGKTEADLYLDKDGHKVYPMDDNGGGLVDIVSLGLRLASWSLSRTDNVIILDEPFKFLSAGLKPMAQEIFKELSEKLGLQIVMVSHDPSMIEISDRIFKVDKKAGKSFVEVEK